MLTENITKYYQYLQERLEEISSINNELYQKILLVSMIDTLGRARFPAKRKQSKRFIDFIRECADWPDKNRISLYQLHLYLQTDSTATNGTLAKEVRKMIGNLEKRRIYRLNEVDPEMADIQKFAQTDKEKNLVSNSEHVRLLYIYRNHLVHEFRKPGHGSQMFGNDDWPYYHQMTSTWELVYPTKFFINIARSSLDGLKRYLENNQLDPYSSYKFGTMWNQK